MNIKSDFEDLNSDATGTPLSSKWHNLGHGRDHFVSYFLTLYSKDKFHCPGFYCSFDQVDYLLGDFEHFETIYYPHLGDYICFRGSPLGVMAKLLEYDIS